MWQNQETGQLHIVDYKSTAQLGKEPRPLNESLNDMEGWLQATDGNVSMDHEKKGSMALNGYFYTWMGNISPRK